MLSNSFLSLDAACRFGCVCSALLLLSGCKEQTPKQTATSKPLLTTRTATTPTRSPDVSQAQFSTAGAAYVPTEGGLKLRDVSPESMKQQVRAQGRRTGLLNEVIRLAPDYFPPGARVLANPKSEEVVPDATLNLNRAFADPKFWKGRSRRDTQLAFHALARNVAFKNEPKGAPVAVRFLVEGQRIAEIGTFETARPLQPDAILGVDTANQRQAQQVQKSRR